MAAHQFIKSFAALPRIRDSLIELRDAMLSLEAQAADALRVVHRDHRASARNLVHYLAMRRKDLRGLQTHMQNLGLSTLERVESAALPAVDAVLATVDRMLGLQPDAGVLEPGSDHSAGTRRLEKQTRDLLGETRNERPVRIMVTAPIDGGWDDSQVHDLVEQGMDCLRIDCAHGNEAAWLALIRQLRKASDTLGRDCRVLMDLAGSRARTGPLEGNPPVVKIRPQRDLYGRVTRPASVWLTAAALPAPASATPTLRVDAKWLGALKMGEEIRFLDTRGRRRRLTVVECVQGGVRAELDRTAYVTNGTRLARLGKRKSAAQKTTVSGIAARKGRLRLHVGDELVLTLAAVPGVAAVTTTAGRTFSPARVPCTSPESLRQVVVGNRVSIDDGQLAGVVVGVSGEGVRMRIDHTPARGARLTADMRIHLPDCTLDLPAITPTDAQHLAFVAAHADLIGLSSTHTEFDVQSLREHLAAQPGRAPGIVVRIETRSGFDNLPPILLSAMRHPLFGVLVGREDLALECGHERLAAIQEEIVRVCAAAHCPTLWAIQTFEGLARTGTSSRAEMTDAAMNHHGQCIILGRGRHVGEALRSLAQSLKRLVPETAREPLMLRESTGAVGFRAPSGGGRRRGQSVVGIHGQRRSTIESGTTDTD